MLGSWWAYYELGWGGWWFWDPVENASFMPLAGGHGAGPFAGRHREARQLQELDGAAGHPRLLALAAGAPSRALGRAQLGARLRHRPAPRPVHPRLPGGRDRLLADALCLARPTVGPGRASRCSRARRCCCSTTCCWWPPPARCCWVRSTAGAGCALARARSRSARHCRHRLRAADGAAGLPDGRGPDRAGSRPRCPTSGRACAGRWAWPSSRRSPSSGPPARSVRWRRWTLAFWIIATTFTDLVRLRVRGGQYRRAPEADPARDGRHDGGTSASPSSSSASRWSRATGRARRQDGRRRQHHGAAVTFTFKGA